MDAQHRARILFVGAAPTGPKQLELRDGLKAAGHEVLVTPSANEALRALRKTPIDAVLTDVETSDLDGSVLCQHVVASYPGTPVLFLTDVHDFDAAVDALRAGAEDYLDHAAGKERIERALTRAVRSARLETEVTRLTQELSEVRATGEIIGRSAAIRKVTAMIRQVAESDATVLIEGESGTGKELVARALHQASGRRGRFVAFNCAALPENLVESELFGHVEGAFTGAGKARDGLFVAADGGTLFLDEIGELPQAVQPKLLRAMEVGAVRRVGGQDPVAFDARLVAATNRDLEAAVADGGFREDLYYRINVVRIGVPPLREREDDVLLLAQYFLDRFASSLNKPVRSLSSEAADFLLRHAWPGNVRELENAIERAVTFAKHEELLPADLPDAVRGEGGAVTRGNGGGGLTADWPTLGELEKRYVMRVLEEADGNKAKAARMLGIDRRTLYRKLSRWDDDGGDASADARAESAT